MASSDDLPASQPGEKRRRQQRSCDICRQRKSSCVGPMANGSCTNCLAFGLACTYFQPSKKRGPKYTKNPATMEDLKREITRLKARLRSLSICSLCSGPLQSQRQESDSCESRSASPIQQNAPKEPPDEKELTNDELASRFSQFSLTPFNANYFGAGSGFALVNNTSMMKDEFLGPSSVAPSRRPYFWQALPWEKEAFDPQPGYVYPPDDLITSLVNLYFINVHPTIPILHRPSFERSVAQGLHRKDMSFGGMLLSMLAIASRYSTDPRICLHGALLSAGWKFARQLWGVRKFFQSTIYEVQMYAFLTFFVLGTSVPHIAWLYAGLGIRCVQQRGEHRRKPEGHKWSLEDELWKRSFWFLVSMERIICVFLGRPLSIHTDEYDVEFPLAVDDKYLDQELAQPPGIPSQLSYFVCYSQLINILGDALRRLYGPKKAKMAMGWDGPEWEQRAVAELDSAMNQLLDSIPPHLRWDPENLSQDIVFLDQSAQLHITYNYILIAIHRRYIQKPSGSSLSICATAARTILHTADIWLSKLQRLPVPNITNPVFVSGVILVLHILATKRAGFPVDKNQDLLRVATALEILKFAESRLQPIGRLWELLRELWALDGPLPLDNLPKSDSHSNARSADVHTSAVSSGQYYYPQLEQPFDYSMLASNQPSSIQSKSMELLVSDVAQPHSSTADGWFDDEIMSMWMAAPTDIVNPQHWNAFMQYRNENGAEANWFHGFCEQYA
ncbi:Fungal-trans domain-containing protein [Mycena sanguinolenta]|uniref:Fungal-trans domain-containing protein n=1 Tax=Mycena sanguinolenta TaxID=230812 RepID=A0A8H6Z8Z5_9AGAR|nr:Fungal-trans domain-containing protein [Mycena sanguinolenta]